MRLPSIMMRRLVVALPGPALVATSLIVLAMGDEPARVYQQDREVLEAALKDILDPKNPLYKNSESDHRPPPREITIVLHRLAGDDADADVLKDQKMISAELAKSLRQRNSGEPIPLKKLGLQGKEFIIIDLDELDEQAQKAHRPFWGLFRERYPDTVGCTRLSLPGYTRGGTAAVVVIEVSRAEYHPNIYLILLAKVEGRWNVGWRHLETR
jgi:hypothetical protein